MNIRTILVLAVFFSGLVSALRAHEDEVAIPLESPDGWRGETIAIPPNFAPDMKFRGVEKIRFAPGMFNSNSETFFSYVFVFRLDQKENLALEVIEREILVYYRGLAKAVGGEDIKTEEFTLELKKVEQEKGKKRKPAAVTATAGILDWVEPFVTQKPQKLRLELHTWKDDVERYSYLFCCASPAAPDKEIWKEMREVRKQFLKSIPADVPSESSEAP